MSRTQRPSSPVASVAQVLKNDPLMVRNQKKSRKRPQPWELSDPESDGALERKKRRVGEKQVRYAYVAHKFSVSVSLSPVMLFERRRDTLTRVGDMGRRGRNAST